jgi:RNA polymerase sigma-70 factor (ECF subfamily)
MGARQRQIQEGRRRIGGPQPDDRTEEAVRDSRPDVVDDLGPDDYCSDDFRPNDQHDIDDHATVNLTPAAATATLVPDLPAAAAERVWNIEDVFRRYAAGVHNYLRAAGATDSEDLLSEVFVDVLRSLERFQGDDDALRRWVFTIAHHRLVDDHRRRARRRRLLLTQRGPRVAPPDEPLDPALVAALDALTPDQREVVVLRFVADLSLETVAAMTNRAEGAVKSLQHRALRNLAATLAAGTDA